MGAGAHISMELLGEAVLLEVSILDRWSAYLMRGGLVVLRELDAVMCNWSSLEVS